MKINNSQRRSSNAAISIALTLIAVLVMGSFSIVFSYVGRNYERVDQQIQAENLASSETTKSSFLNKVLIADGEYELAISALKQGKEADATDHMVKYNRLEGEIRIQVSKWERMGIFVPNEVSEFIRRADERKSK